MGCDIHLYVENKNESTGKYTLVPNFFPLNSRNYWVFAFLGNVRNHTSIQFKFLSDCREIPDDCSPAVKKSFKDWDVDAHSASYLNVEELAAIDFNLSLKHFIKNEITPSYEDYFREKIFPIHSIDTFTLAQALGGEFMEELRQIFRLVPKGRIVFWFDN